MATNSHGLRTHSHQTLNSVCHGTLSLNNHPLSKSSSNLAGVQRADSEERQNGKQELRKSLSSSACQTQVRENDVGSTPSSEWSSTHSEIASTVRTVSSVSLSDSTQSTAKSSKHFLCVDQSPVSGEGMGMRTHIKSSTIDNVSSPYGANPQHVSTMEGLGAGVQRSLSDLSCSCKQQSSIPHMESSATYSAMSSNSSYGTSAGHVAHHRPRYGSETYENTTDFQSHMTQVPSLPRDQNVPTNIFDNGALSHNATVFADPVAYHTNVLGSHMHGDNLSNRAMYAQGGIVYSNFSSGMYPSGMMAIHNSSALPYNIRQEAAMKVEGTIPAYCHSLPIPSVQFIPRLVCSASESGKEQVNPGYCPSLPTTEMATPPKLVSSVSESGLDAKRILRCCSTHGEHMMHAQPYPQPNRTQQEMKTTYVVLNSHQDGVNTVTKTKDTWTMTSMNDIARGLQPPPECKDAEVQTIPTKECKSVATSPSVVAEGHPHVFPEVNLEPEAEGEKSPVREVRWDDEGMTWEVYGAAVDPEVLGLAIQKHLEIQIEQFQMEPVVLSRKCTEELPAKEEKEEEEEEKEEKKTSFRTMLHCLRNPSCCARSSTAVE
ncbi:G protein-regulated inducer of neurite outgrowth 2 isoform X2 [Hemicordylus capensis]|nr:G protein-regulated inducer of neurite outgrowth 2 isoform X2 [Hemicordylus capensis]XP_053167838.1 G protein-regulated inducer of neurite outgrowth 2 isoform X2 [Hemicordylus capensis]XP_053167839.1 G protein-regulated inducer of neurite outgrowth 2 isoform X2 [Hemicordylus capensis]